MPWRVPSFSLVLSAMSMGREDDIWVWRILVGFGCERPRAGRRRRAGTRLSSATSQSFGLEELGAAGRVLSERVDAATKEASTKSGLTAQTAAAIGNIVSGYVSERSMGAPEEKAKVRADFERKYGTSAAEAMDRHEAELTKLQEETLKAALGPAKN